jgi:hypothetical protein
MRGSFERDTAWCSISLGIWSGDSGSGIAAALRAYTMYVLTYVLITPSRVRSGAQMSKCWHALRLLFVPIGRY